MRVYLVRHAETDWNRQRRAQGHTDIGLNAEGLLQAKGLGEWELNPAPTRILSSDLTRCVQTATPLADRLGITIEARGDLRERTFGEWEGRVYEEVREGLWALSPEWPEGARPPQGESIEDVWGRLEVVAEEIRQATAPLMVVAHGGANALLLARLLHAPIRTARSFSFPNCAVTVLDRRPDGDFVLRGLATMDHLCQDQRTPAYGIVG